ncbi:MAG: hypothetical protein RL032_2008 [Pseudomonadota bacterium]
MQNTLTLHRLASTTTNPTAPRTLRQSQLQGASEQPNGRTFIELLTAFRDSGGTAPGDVVARLLAEYQCSKIETLATLVAQKRVFNFEWRGCCWFPMFQFELSDWSLKSGPHQVCETLPRESSSWTIALWFASPNLRLKGQTPANMLETDLSAVLDAASNATTALKTIPENAQTCAVGAKTRPALQAPCCPSRLPA